MPVIPSVKYHLPRLGEPFRGAEYAFTTSALTAAWGDGPLLVEQDFSPTLAGDALASEKAQVLRWVREVPGEIRRAAPGGGPVRVALKLMNARFGDAFQLEMLAAAWASGADALVVFNRLYDHETGVAYGGWDLSERNLRVLDLFLDSAPSRSTPSHAVPPGSPVSLSGTGNIGSGRLILEYARRGCESVQLHTFFQLPLDQYPAATGSRTQRALHALLFHPIDGLVAGMLELGERGGLTPRDGMLRFLDLTDAHHPR
jgi:hypothetical protein